jgi:serine/threonine protein phosphatase PrpC
MADQDVRLTVYGRSDVGRVRERNEDAFVIADLMASHPIHAMQSAIVLEVGARGILLAVSDGMGGEQAGDVASALTLHVLRRGMMTVNARSAEAALQSSVERANQRVFAAASEPSRKGMGATITAVLLYGNRAYVAEVGDSRAYLLRGNKLLQVTHDQSYAQCLLDEGTLTREQAETFPYKNVILQAIGNTPSVVVAMSRFTLRQKDRILLCSDGLSGKVNDAELQSIIAGGTMLDWACSALVDKANSRGGDDNITVVLAEMDGDGLAVSVADTRVSLENLQEFKASASCLRDNSVGVAPSK